MVIPVSVSSEGPFQVAAIEYGGFEIMGEAT